MGQRGTRARLQDLREAFERAEEYLFLSFLLPAVLFWAYFLNYHFIWDEWLYFELAEHVAQDPLDPLPEGYTWIPHPPLLWYLICPFRPVPRLAILLTSCLCLLAVYLTAKELYGRRAASYAVAATLASWNFIMYSIVLFTDMVMASFTSISALAFLLWLEKRREKHLLLACLAYALASLTKYTAIPVLLATFLLGFLISREELTARDVAKAVSGLALASIPVALWVHHISSTVGGGFLAYYSSIYRHEGITVLQDAVFYARYMALTIGVPLVLWVKDARKFDRKLSFLAAYVLVNFISLVLLRTVLSMYQIYDRYLLPVGPVAALISGKFISDEGEKVRAAVFTAMLGYTAFLIHQAYWSFVCAPTWKSIEEILRPPVRA